MMAKVSGKTMERTSQNTVSFKDRLQFLMGTAKPYAWCKKVGIEKGLFQYYWQMGKIPKYDNLIKIRNYTGCSLDWLMTGEGEPFPDRIEDINSKVQSLMADVDDHIDRLGKQIVKLKKLKTGIKTLK
ncbi:hypothetical protein MNBD_NITROSPINAE01-1417 [hydrothermal vent metagenome]|uniref:HTH cro/C1-type domain-containing protein n=1 Tax=hydrothermal vent metagenome TaxID=652676 RepID=A0A3B1C4Y1_9ZZZZ